MQMTVELELMMKALGYTPEWLDFGIVTEEYLREQYMEYLRSDEDNQDRHLEEHGRKRAFHDFIVARHALTDDEITRILQLKDDGPDCCDLRVDRVADMIWRGILTDSQMADLGRLPEVHEAPLQHMYLRECRWRRLQSEGLTPEVFREIADSGDGELQRAVLSRSDVGRDHVAWLAEHGANKAVRNVAKQLLKSRSLRKKAGDARP
jgi:hypothetical protein